MWHTQITTKSPCWVCDKPGISTGQDFTVNPTCVYYKCDECNVTWRVMLPDIMMEAG